MINAEEYTPVVANNVEQYEKISSLTHYYIDEKAAARVCICVLNSFQSMVTNVPFSFPKIFPFSKTLPTCCQGIRDFVDRFYQFTEGFSQQHGELDDLLKKVVYYCLFRLQYTYLTRESIL